MSHWEEFYAVHLPPVDFEDSRVLLKDFSDRHLQENRPIVLVTVSFKKINLTNWNYCPDEPCSELEFFKILVSEFI